LGERLIDFAPWLSAFGELLERLPATESFASAAMTALTFAMTSEDVALA